MRILGIDPALKVTGYGVIEVSGSKLKLVEAGVIETSLGDCLPLRLKRIYDSTQTVLREFRPDVAVLEKIYSHYAHPATSYILGHARGAICLACACEEVQVAEYAATRVKKAVVGKGLASKQQVQRMVLDSLGIREIPDYTDITDALALAIAHSFIIRVRV